MRSVLCTTALGLLLWSVPLQAQGFFFAWDYERARNPEAFLLTAEGPGGRITWRTTPSAPGACPGQGSGAYCTRVPQCPALGAATFSVVAIVQGQPCPPTVAPLACRITSQTPCVVQCDNPPGVTFPPGGAPLATVPTTDAPAEVFETADGGVILDIQEPPTHDPQPLPPLQEAPPSPAFQPMPSRAPV